MSIISNCDLVITVAYFSIPLQILVALWNSPPHRKIPMKLVVTLVLFAFFIFLCGTGHLMRYFGQGHTTAMIYVHVATALVSLATALYLIPLIPCMFSLLDESLNKLTNETKESKSKLFTFMAFLCHEIRNPLFAITSSAEFLKDGDLRPDQAEEVSSICDSSLLMLRLVNDVLDLSKLDSGKLELESLEFDLHSLLRRLGENMTRQVGRKHKGSVQMIFDMAPNVPRVVMGDSCRILQIVYNLLSNSSKFCSTGSIELKVRLANEETEREEQAAAHKAGARTVTMSSDQPCALLSSEFTGEEIKASGDEKNLFSMALLDADVNTDLEAGECGDLLPANQNESIMILSISVSDSGIGIPSERLQNIFEPYTQAKLSDFRQHGGTGLGLSIISSLIKAMGGTVSVTSKEGEGTRFHLKIPVRVPHHSTLMENDDSQGGARMNFGGEECSDDSDNQFLDSRRLPLFENASEKSIGMSSPTSTATLSDGSPNGHLPLFPTMHGDKASALFSLSDASKDAMNNSSATSSTVDLLDPRTDTESGFPLGLDSSQASTSSRRTRTPSPTPPALPSFDFPSRSNMVLVVDDNSVNRKILGKMLKTYNLEYETACNGQEAVDILLQSQNATGDISRTRFGLVFMDVSMPVMDGNVAVQTIRAAKISVPIVALSANVLSQERDRTICLGANEFHTKPILRSNLHILCTRYLYKDGLPLGGSPDCSSRRDASGLMKSRSSSSSESSTDPSTSSEVELSDSSQQQPSQIDGILL